MKKEKQQVEVKKSHNFAFLIALFSFSFLFFNLAAPRSAHAALLTKPSPSNLSLLGYWPMNEGSGSYAGDFSGNGNTGLLTSGPTWAQGRRGQALNFDGVDDRVSLEDVNAFDGLGTYTISAWVYAGSAGEGSAGRIYDKRNSGATGLQLNILTANGSTTVAVTHDSTTRNAQANAISTRLWQHVVVTYDGSLFPKIYVNGAEVSISCSASCAFAGFTANAVAAQIGNTASEDGTFDGVIDEVRIYNRVLSASEVLALYKSGAVTHKQAPNLGLVGYWSFNEATSTPYAGDSSGNRNDGVLTGGPTQVIGKRGNALNFDGVNDYVDIATTTLSGQFAVSLWWKNADNVSTRMAIGLDVPGDGVTQKIGAASSKFFIRVVSSSDNTIALPSQDAWHFIVVTRDASNKVDLYIDNGAANRLFSDVAQIGDFTPSLIGSSGNDSNLGQDFKGLLDEVRIYNRALSAGEIYALYKSSAYANVNSSQNSKVRDGLVGLWSFDGMDMYTTGGGTPTTAVADQSGRGNDGTLSGAAARIAGKIGQALHFDGSSASVSIGTPSILNNLAALSVSVWIKFDSTTGDKRIVGKCTGATNCVGWKLLINATNNRIFFRVDYDTQDLIHNSNSNLVLPDAWYHIVLTWDGSATAANARIYVNGSEVTYATATNASTNRVNDSTTSFIIGAATNGSDTFNGSIDDVRVYNRVLTTDEIKRLYNMGR
ncbi:MAG: LamG domain-containing protein [Candidatus Sungbacteria bacterium]|uniref:LamG domain-containing protein n=1 Tax=Candidatus Sungiibacteriota bacterium TaxID=2750080 RepID=A0A931SB57_9BACT|nr:LamG domain-containing protein [Candidatus Sungbacteria bacterium]